MVSCLVALVEWQFLFAYGQTDGYLAAGIDIDGYGDVDGSAGRKLWLARRSIQCGWCGL